MGVDPDPVRQPNAPVAVAALLLPVTTWSRPAEHGVSVSAAVCISPTANLLIGPGGRGSAGQTITLARAASEQRLYRSVGQAMAVNHGRMVGVSRPSSDSRQGEDAARWCGTWPTLTCWRRRRWSAASKLTDDGA